jgi:AcrR family transcriptional regulator
MPQKSDRKGKQRDAERTKRALAHAAAELFSIHGYSQVGVRDIAAKADVDFTLVRRYFGSKQGIFSAALDEAVPADLFTRFATMPSGEVLTEAFTRNPAEHARALPMLLLSTGDADAREIALDAFRTKIAVPLTEILGGDSDAARRALCILAVATGFFTFHRLLPIEPMGAPLTSEIRQWLTRTFQNIVAERPSRKRRRPK